MNLFTRLTVGDAIDKIKTPFGRIGRYFRNLSLTDPKAWNSSLWNPAGARSDSGEVVTEKTALTYSAVFNANALISGTLGSLPLHLKQKIDRKTENFTKIPLYRLMHTQPNPYMTAMAFREVLSSHALMWGNGYAEKVFNGYGEIVELWPITPDRVIKIELRNGVLEYDIRVGTKTITLSREQILHVPGLGYDGLMGYSVITMARKSIGLGMALESFGSLYFGQGTHPGVIISHPNQLDTAGHANLKKSLTETYSGLGKSHRLMLLEDGMTIDKIGIPPNDSQFLESRQFQIPEIARWFNLPPHKLKDLTKSSFSNIEAEQTSFVTDSILPWLVRFEQNYNTQLLTIDQYEKQDLYFKHIIEGLLRANSRDRAIFYKTMWAHGFITQNEVREKEDMNPNANPLADELFVPLNMSPLSQYEQRRDEARKIMGLEPFKKIAGGKAK